MADEHPSVRVDKGVNAGLKVAFLVSGMVAGADSIDDMDVLRNGGTGRVFTNASAHLFTFGHVRQLDAVASRFLTGLATQASLVAGIDEYALVDVNDTTIEVHGHARRPVAHPVKWAFVTPTAGRSLLPLRGPR